MEAIVDTQTQPPAVVRTERGLTIAGTRITLYQIMDYIRAGWSPEQMQAMHSLTEGEITGALEYIEAHRAEVEAEYELVLRQAEEIRQYWEQYNRERRAEVAQTPPKPGDEALWAKLQEAKQRLGMDS